MSPISIRVVLVTCLLLFSALVFAKSLQREKNIAISILRTAAQKASLQSTPLDRENAVLFLEVAEMLESASIEFAGDGAREFSDCKGSTYAFVMEKRYGLTSGFSYSAMEKNIFVCRLAVKELTEKDLAQALIHESIHLWAYFKNKNWRDECLTTKLERTVMSYAGEPAHIFENYERICKAKYPGNWP